MSAPSTLKRGWLDCNHHCVSHYKMAQYHVATSSSDTDTQLSLELKLSFWVRILSTTKDFSCHLSLSTLRGQESTAFGPARHILIPIHHLKLLFQVQWQSSIVEIETRWLAKPQIWTICPFIENTLPTSYLAQKRNSMVLIFGEVAYVGWGNMLNGFIVLQFLYWYIINMFCFDEGQIRVEINVQ